MKVSIVNDRKPVISDATLAEAGRVARQREHEEAALSQPLKVTVTVTEWAAERIEYRLAIEYRALLRRQASLSGRNLDRARRANLQEKIDEIRHARLAIAAARMEPHP